MAVGAWNKPPRPTGGGGNTGGGGSSSSNNSTVGSVILPKWQDDVYVDTSRMGGVAGASDPTSNVYNYQTDASTAKSEYASGAGYMDAGMTKWLEQVAKAIDYRKTGKGLWEDAVDASGALWENHQVRKTPYQIIVEWAGQISPKSSGGGDGSRGSGGGSGAKGPSPADPSAIRRAMDQVTMGLIGRSLSDKEFNRYYQSYVSEFSGNPDMDPGQDMIERARKDEGYQEYQIATKFAGALDKVLRGAA